MKISPFNLSDKTILVTGASSGIGRQVAITLNAMGANLYINGRNIQRLQDTKNQLYNKDLECLIISGDLTEIETVKKLISEIESLDGVVFASGIMKLLPFKFIQFEELNAMMNVNFTSPIHLTLELIKNKKLKQRGSIVYITSITGSVIGTIANSMYAASKGALSGMAKAISLDLAKNKIRVNEIAPGMIKTEGAEIMTDTVSNDSVSKDALKYPLKSYGTPEDVANGCVYLLSDASKWVTGTKLVIDGGFTAQ
jgi:NAD(P)-dependent dehydrogenase (short-subunit alcohol dehydrogenase family)